MYLCAYGPLAGPVHLLIWQGEALYTDLRLYTLPENPPIPIFPGGEPLRAELT
jgi:hypothetical protein